MSSSKLPKNKNTINVHDLHSGHPQIRAEDFRSPLIRRLSKSDKYKDGQALINNCYRAIDGKITNSELSLRWLGLAEDHRKCLNTYQVPVITEMATLGLACILLTYNTEQEITEVTRRGDKADYWVGDREAMLEISGQQDGNINEICKRKACQLLENPFAQNGYVCVAIYNDGQTRLWFYAQNRGNI